RFLEKYDNLTPHIIVQIPFWKIRVGDFRTREEAYYLYKKIVKDFPNSYIVRDQIDFPELD
ncbi:MAG: SPOR domain-containing protein, partial [Bacteroidota bacterium]